MATFIISVCDYQKQRWPSATKLLDHGVPASVVERYRHIRWDMTTGLKRRIKEARN